MEARSSLFELHHRIPELDAISVLEGYRKIEARNGNGEISFFQKEDKTILDGEYMVASIDESLEEAKRLYVKLAQTESPKEQFFIKQEIINHQEILRKYILRNLKMCEKEGAIMPKFTEDILNLDILKEMGFLYATKAGEKCARMFANREAVEHYRRAARRGVPDGGLHDQLLVGDVAGEDFVRAFQVRDGT
jgi:TPR repeat protein